MIRFASFRQKSSVLEIIGSNYSKILEGANKGAYIFRNLSKYRSMTRAERKDSLDSRTPLADGFGNCEDLIEPKRKVAVAT